MVRRRARPLHLILAVVAIVAIGALTACGTTPSSTAPGRVDHQQVESLLTERARERNPGLSIGASSCPQGVLALAGESFQCVVLVDGQPVRYEVEVTEVLAKRVRFDLRPLQMAVDVTGVVTFVRSLLEESWRAADIDCGPVQSRVVDVGAILDCVAFTGTATRYFEVEIVDADGTLELRER